MKKVLVTGHKGFIGRALVLSLSHDFKVVTLASGNLDKRIDVSDWDLLKEACQLSRPDIVIHCAGLKQPKTAGANSNEFEKINHLSTIHLAKEAINANPDVHFIFLSSISVYGVPDPAGDAIGEDNELGGKTIYAKSKVNAEISLRSLFSKNESGKLDILRLAPVYDQGYGFNLEKRVLCLKGILFVRYATGEQKVSLLSRKNLIEFIRFRIKTKPNNKTRLFVANVTDEAPYSFNELLLILKQSRQYPAEHIMTIPLWILRGGVRLLGLFFYAKQDLLNYYYDKLTRSWVFKNKKMLDTGFKPRQCVRTTFFK